MALIRTYAGLAMVCGAAMLLLPQGGLRHTAALAMGLTLALFWLQGVAELFRLPEVPIAPDTLLAPVASSEEAYAALFSRAYGDNYRWEDGQLLPEGG